jgi:hypothetical protein
MQNLKTHFVEMSDLLMSLQVVLPSGVKQRQTEIKHVGFQAVTLPILRRTE